jgi:hydroxypyruvate isomerase
VRCSERADIALTALPSAQTAVHEFSVKKLREHATAVFQEQVGALVRRVDQAAAQGTALDLQVGALKRCSDFLLEESVC